MWMEKPVPINDSLPFSTIHTTYYYRYRLNENNQEAEEEELCVSEPNVTISPMS
jgi:hypothetical protein